MLSITASHQLRQDWWSATFYEWLIISQLSERHLFIKNFNVHEQDGEHNVAYHWFQSSDNDVINLCLYNSWENLRLNCEKNTYGTDCSL